ncbi:Coenzyme F420 hydrogenase/dehydrogenase, beta subunit C-terminal domain [Eubacterium callanderi]|uniref:Coenzyme F420 hydrogenase/dehydrogenase, beta subunit C-terminal domain n=1 Tax=Eubacterium callanderi TaxID=53442 RepID=A0A853JTM8_9FIRM|nr:Coenzyme F420 hydrogenase/dehydrogenase, beta subunit C-terminal domain [Eubacterium callanderi]
MINKIQIKECCGCTACKSICPQNAIQMKQNKEGFFYPVINENNCIECGFCTKVCQKTIKTSSNYPIETYAAFSKNEKIRSISSSGGIFGSIADYYLKNGYLVYGARFNESFEVIHAKVNKDVESFYGSKYVQSNLENVYISIKNELKDGKKILFIGTPCQVLGLNNFLKQKNCNKENLLLLDFICHGVPSPLILKNYLLELEKKYNSKIRKVSFRNKTYGWNLFSLKIEFYNNNTYIKNLKEDAYLQGFLKNLTLGESCYKCKANNFRSNSDITLGDYWGVEKFLKDYNYNDDKGVSLLLINTLKGKKLINILSNKIVRKDINLQDAIKYNPCIIKSVKRNKKRNKFFNDINNKKISVTSLMKFYTQITFKEKITKHMKQTIKNMLEG